MNKAAFTAAKNAQITAVVDIPEHRAAMLLDTNEFFKETINDTQATTNVLTKTYTNANYNLNLKKVGNTVFVTGLIKVVGGSTFNTGGILATFTDAEYKPKDTVIFYINGNELGTGNAITFFFRGDTPGTITNGRPMSNNTQYSINGFYTTND